MDDYFDDDNFEAVSDELLGSTIIPERKYNGQVVNINFVKGVDITNINSIPKKFSFGISIPTDDDETEKCDVNEPTNDDETEKRFQNVVDVNEMTLGLQNKHTSLIDLFCI